MSGLCCTKSATCRKRRLHHAHCSKLVEISQGPNLFASFERSADKADERHKREDDIQYIRATHGMPKAGRRGEKNSIDEDYLDLKDIPKSALHKRVTSRSFLSIRHPSGRLSAPRASIVPANR